MRVWSCNDHDRHYPVPAASVIVAETQEQARALLVEALKKCGVHQRQDDFTLVEIDTAKSAAHVLADGDY
jgi:hypothetical protein